MIEVKYNPRITIGITSYDRFELLKETINSVRNQSFSDFIAIISNDNPARKLDYESLEIEKDQRFIIINHESNLGEINNLNYLLKAAKTEYFTWLSDDDLLHPLYLKNAITELDNHKDAAVYYSSFSSGEFWDLDNVEINNTAELRTYDRAVFLPLYASRSIKLIGCYGVFRQNLLNDLGGFKQLGCGFAPYADTLLPILISEKGGILFKDAPFVFLRTHDRSLSNSSSNLCSYVSAQEDFLKEISSSIKELVKIEGRKIQFDFFNWFSSDRAAVISRSSKFFWPLLTQLYLDLISLIRMEINFRDKLRSIPAIYKRLYVTGRTLLKAKLSNLINEFNIK